MSFYTNLKRMLNLNKKNTPLENIIVIIVVKRKNSIFLDFSTHFLPTLDTEWREIL